jgi:hypothetical protein
MLPTDVTRAPFLEDPFLATDMCPCLHLARAYAAAKGSTGSFPRGCWARCASLGGHARPVVCRLYQCAMYMLPENLAMETLMAN